MAIQDFLIFYQHQVNDLESKATTHRIHVSLTSEQVESKCLSLMELKVLMAPLIAQMTTIAGVCFTTKFIGDI